jgi:Na+/melibiose symporter-like transporter
MAYFVILPAMFNTGWAAVQIATMALVVSVTLSQGRRDTLVSLRNGFTYIANLLALVVAIIFILTIDNQIWTFRLLAWTLTIIGFPLSIYFIISIPEVRLAKEAISCDKDYRKVLGKTSKPLSDDKAEPKEDDNEEEEENEDAKTWNQWLTSGVFYVHAVVYTFSRMAVNVTMTLTPFYLIHVLDFSNDPKKPVAPQIATVPLCSYACSMIFTLFIYSRMINAFGNRLYPLAIGTSITILSSIPFIFMRPSFSWLVYIAASFQGVGLAIMLNIATSLISDVIGNDDKSSAFVYGTYSLFDKFVNGALLVIIGNTVIEDKDWLIWLSSLLPIISAVFTFTFAWIGKVYYADKMRGVSVQK